MKTKFVTKALTVLLAKDYLTHLLLLQMISIGLCKECVFPDYVQSMLDENGNPIPWHTKVWWLNLRNEPKLREMQEVFVVRSQIWSQRQNNRWSCDRKSKRVAHRAISELFGTCSEKYLLYNRTCLSAENDFNVFKVIQYGVSRTPMFLCIKFVKRSDNVIQIMESPMRDRNDPDLCDERKLHLEEWPWIAPWRRHMITCPISGGFSFRTINKLTNQDFCEDDWRKSRLEIDCANGDGLNFIAPKGTKCNPFSSKSEVSRLHCWAGWNEGSYTFLVVGDDSGVPQYCLRFPRDVSKQFSVMVYFSVLCPMQEDGMPPTGIEYHEMLMNKLDDSRCVDDDEEQCETIMRRGQCKKEEKYAMHCEKACKRCQERLEMLHSECVFQDFLRAKWIFSDYHHREEVRVNKTAIHFDKFGTFRCIGRRLISGLYKTVTSFDNGCAMRYTCFEFRRPSGYNTNVLQFRVGKSYRTDLDFEGLCKFEDDYSSPRNIYRSATMKNLIFSGELWDAYCGLSGSIPFNGTIYGEPCHGTVSDWDSNGCVQRGRINIRSQTCKNLEIPLEYQCLVFLEDDSPLHPLEHYIITKSVVTNEFNCWVLTTYRCDHWDWPHGRVLYKLDTAQCTAFSDSTCAVDRTPEAILFLHDDERSKYCRTAIISHYKSSATTTSSLTHSRHTSGKPDNPYYIDKNREGGRHTATVYPINSGGGGRENMHAINSISMATSILYNMWFKTFPVCVTILTFGLLMFLFPT